MIVHTHRCTGVQHHAKSSPIDPRPGSPCVYEDRRGASRHCETGVSGYSMVDVTVRNVQVDILTMATVIRYMTLYQCCFG